MELFDICQKVSPKVKDQKKLMVLILLKFSQLALPDQSTISCCKTCHLMAAASGIEAARKTTNKDDKVNHCVVTLSCHVMFRLLV